MREALYIVQMLTKPGWLATYWTNARRPGMPTEPEASPVPVPLEAALRALKLAQKSTIGRPASYRLYPVAERSRRTIR
jgi:hypothetical protein